MKLKIESKPFDGYMSPALADDIEDGGGGGGGCCCNCHCCLVFN